MFKIRKRKTIDDNQILKIWEDASKIAHHFLDEEFLDIEKNAIKNSYLHQTDTWLYIENNNIFGFISMIDNEIGGLFVTPTQQSKGIDTKLINVVKQNHQELIVHVFEKNSIGISFYLKSGFIPILKTYHKKSNQTLIKMKLNLHKKDI
jgi:putative acetyltransferase